MLLSVLLVAGLLLGPACCAAPPAAAAASGTSSPQQAAAPSSETSPPQQTAAPAAETAGASLPMAETRADVTLDQVVAELSSLYRATTHAAAAESLAELTKTLASIQASVTAVSGRLDLVHDSQLQQQKVQDDLARRLGAIEEAQTEASARLDTMQSTLSTVQEAQSELSGALSARFDRVEASQGDLSSRLGDLSSQVDTLLQQQQQTAGTATSGPGGLQQQLDAIQAAVALIPKTVLGRACGSDTDCSTIMPEAECGGGGRCSCQDGFRQVSNTECRRHSRLSEVCLEDADCQTLASNATCSSGTCGCVSGFWNHNNEECRRVSAVSKGGACVDDQDCVSGLHVQCVSGTCSCHVKAVGDYDYRLTGGSDCSEGNVQLRRSGGSWGLVCDDGWSSANAKVVCRSLGFTSGTLSRESAYGRGTNYYMDDVRCGGSEPHLMRCSYLGWGKHNCGAEEVAGVRCF